MPAGPQGWQGLPYGGRTPGVCFFTPAAVATMMGGLRLRAGAMLCLKAGCLELEAHLGVALAAGSAGSLAHLQLPRVQQHALRQEAAADKGGPACLQQAHKQLHDTGKELDGLPALEH